MRALITCTLLIAATLFADYSCDEIFTVKLIFRYMYVHLIHRENDVYFGIHIQSCFLVGGGDGVAIHPLLSKHTIRPICNFLGGK